MKIHKDHIYLTTTNHIYLTTTNHIFLPIPHFLKVNKKGETVKNLELNTPLCGIFIEGSNIYTCLEKSLTVQIFDLNLKPTKKIFLNAISFNEDTTPRDIILHKQQMFVLFSYYSNLYHPNPIQAFKLDGTLMRSLVTGNDINNACYFCLDSYENILVSDCHADCIRISSPEGILIQKIGGEDGELRRPMGITVDSKQRIIIVDNLRLHAF